MKVIVRTRAALLHDSELMLGMHRLRGRVFKDRLDWDVSVCDGLEIDQYDTFQPTYLLALEQSDVVGCVRLLPTTGRNMLADTFPVLLDGNPAPSATRIWESSRFCIDTKSAAATAENGLGLNCVALGCTTRPMCQSWAMMCPPGAWVASVTRRQPAICSPVQSPVA